MPTIQAKHQNSTHARIKKSSSTGKDPASIHPGLKSFNYLDPKLGSVYFRMHQGEGPRCMSTEAFLAWKSLLAKRRFRRQQTLLCLPPRLR